MLTSPVLEYDQRNVQLWRGDCLHHLWDTPTNSIDSIVTDPPAGIAFMGKGWDKDRGGRDKWVDWLTERMEEAYRVLKPGGHALVWALPRTSHWTALALEDAGFEIRDCITHLFGTGFPKSKSVLKPASEHWWLVRKPFNGAVAAIVLKHGVGALNINACRVNTKPRTTHSNGNHQGTAPQPMSWGKATNYMVPGADGRWPSNVIISHANTPDGYDACADGCVDGCPVAELDHQSGNSLSTVGKPCTSKIPGNGWGMKATGAEYLDNGGASRFFPVFRYQAKAPTSERPKIDGKSHNTVKSLALMRWLIRLITPPDGTVLDMFAGSGSTGEAARAEGMSAILIDSDPDSIAWSIQRLERTASLPA
jgi:site-specific DNA-methyltransferase (adenine-specific)